jgi:hypothetical protein
MVNQELMEMRERLELMDPQELLVLTEHRVLLVHPVQQDPLAMLVHWDQQVQQELQEVLEIGVLLEIEGLQDQRDNPVHQEIKARRDLTAKLEAGVPPGPPVLMVNQGQLEQSATVDLLDRPETQDRGDSQELMAQMEVPDLRALQVIQEARVLLGQLVKLEISVPQEPQVNKDLPELPDRPAL